MTISDAFPVDVPAAVPAASPVRLEKRPRPHARMRTRDASLPRVTAAAKVVWSDLRDSWWLPESVPTVVQAWRERHPDFEKVPGGSDALYTVWVVYNHAALIPIALFNLLVGVLTPAMFVLRHPARLALALLLAALVATAIAVA